MARSLSHFLMVITFLTVTADQSKCRNGWNFFRGFCYYVGGDDSTFSDAESSCRRLDSRLVTLTSPGENAFIKSILKDDDATGAWFDFIFIQRDLRFRWDNSWGASISFTDWANNETEINIDLPQYPGFIMKLQCASFSKQHDWAWEPKACDDSVGMKYVCKRG
ncbi:secretory phospholipase a2 receptor [Plakobranchus ocellatus]|uniref:Secretory phospholipase a2 receptor n=1 Tax=Plakobranchus ocellatus TaxID=259542 RepID=A0AAV4ACU6_9GAST|nr:secretory phospholipase a2 receptor [Plakobranchus ocellatus]